MSTITDSRSLSVGEPKPIIPPLASFYSHTRDLSWLVVRLTAGGMLLVHGIMKVMPMAEKGFAATIDAFAVGSMARRGSSLRSSPPTPSSFSRPSARC
jgi:hypothetical protein